MPRKRMISPEIWRDPKFVSLPDDTTRLLFIGLFSNANDYGKVRGEWWNVRSEIFVMNELSQNKINLMLEELEKKKLIIRYKVNDEEYVKLTTWDKHQKVSHPAKDEFPDPPPETLPRVSGDLPPQGSRREVKLDEVKLDEVKLDEVKLEEYRKGDSPEGKKIESHIEKLKSQFPQDIQELINEYIELARLENKTQKITVHKQKRLINELYLLWLECNQEDIEGDILKSDFKLALKTAVDNEAPNINYVKKVKAGFPRKRKVRLKKANKTWK